MADDRSVPEIDIQHAILEVMKDQRVWTNGLLKQRLRSSLPWSEADLRASAKRPNERMWENRVNNALADARASSLHSKGFVESAGHGEHRITSAGLRYINDEWTLEELEDEMARLQSSSGSD